MFLISREKLSLVKVNMQNLIKFVSIGVDKKKDLDFKEDQNSEYYKEAMKSVSDGWYLKYLVEQSDKRAEELGDTVSATYTRQAQQVARIIKKYGTLVIRYHR